MKTNRTIRASIIFLALVVFLLAQLACGTSTLQQLASAVPSLTAPKQNAENTVGPGSGSGSGPVATQPPSILSTPTPQPEPMSIVAQGFGQVKQDLQVLPMRVPNSRLRFITPMARW